MYPLLDEDPGAEPRTENTAKTEATAPLHHSLLFVSIAAVLGALIFWLVHLDWVLEVIAGLILLSTAALGVLTVWALFRLTEGSYFPKWARLTTAIILGISVFLTVMYVTHSHKLIRYYDSYGSDDD